MSHLVLVLKKEIERVCNIKMAKVIASFEKRSTQRDADMAKLKKQVSDLEATVSRLAKGGIDTSQAVHIAHSKHTPENELRRFSPKGMRAHRKRLQLSAEQMSLLLGVSMQTIYAWEQGRIRPRSKNRSAILALRTMSLRQAHAKLAEMESESNR